MLLLIYLPCPHPSLPLALATVATIWSNCATHLVNCHHVELQGVHGGDEVLHCLCHACSLWISSPEIIECSNKGRVGEESEARCLCCHSIVISLYVACVLRRVRLGFHIPVQVQSPGRVLQQFA